MIEIEENNILTSSIPCINQGFYNFIWTPFGLEKRRKIFSLKKLLMHLMLLSSLKKFLNLQNIQITKQDLKTGN